MNGSSATPTGASKLASTARTASVDASVATCTSGCAVATAPNEDGKHFARVRTKLCLHRGRASFLRLHGLHGKT